jgi:hypothetical protein
MLVNGLNKDKDRRELDYYPTPPQVTAALLEYLNKLYELSTMTCIEPACGTGEMVKILEKYFLRVQSSDIILECYGVGDTDYLTTPYPGSENTALITNPPFKHSEAFIRKAIAEKHFITAMLLKSQYWHSRKRYSLFMDTNPAYILPLTWRPDFYFSKKGSSPTMEVIWTVWVNAPHDNCIYHPLIR